MEQKATISQLQADNRFLNQSLTVSFLLLLCISKCVLSWMCSVCLCLFVVIVVLSQISLVCKVYYKYRKLTLLQKHLDHHGCLERRHDFTKDPSRSQEHCFL